MSNYNNSVYSLYPELIKYPLILKVLIKNRNEDGVSCVSQKEIAKEVRLTQTAISKYLKRLNQYNKCIEKISPGKYIVHKTNMLKYGPVSKVIAFHNEVVKDDNFFDLEFKAQVKNLGFSREAVIMAKHYFIQYISKFDKFEDEKDINKIIQEDFTRYISRYVEK